MMEVEKSAVRRPLGLGTYTGGVELSHKMRLTAVCRHDPYVGAFEQSAAGEEGKVFSIGRKDRIGIVERAIGDLFGIAARCRDQIDVIPAGVLQGRSPVLCRRGTTRPPRMAHPPPRSTGAVYRSTGSPSGCPCMTVEMQDFQLTAEVLAGALHIYDLRAVGGPLAFRCFVVPGGQKAGDVAVAAYHHEAVGAAASAGKQDPAALGGPLRRAVGSLTRIAAASGRISETARGAAGGRDQPRCCLDWHRRDACRRGDQAIPVFRPLRACQQHGPTTVGAHQYDLAAVSEGHGLSVGRESRSSPMGSSASKSCKVRWPASWAGRACPVKPAANATAAQKRSSERRNACISYLPLH